MKRMSVILLPLLMLLAGACGLSRGDRDVESALVRADAVMETYPDSALAILDSIAPDAIRSDALRARYAVGLYHARFKNYEETSDDSLIALAVNYYDGRHGCRRELMLAHYFQARAMYNAGRYSAATYTAMLGADEAAALALPVWEARVNDLLAELCHSTYNIYEDTLYCRKAAGLYLAADSIRNYQCSMIELARAYDDCDKPLQGRQVLESINPRIAKSDSVMQYYYFGTLAGLFMSEHDYDAAHVALDSMKTYSDRWKQYPDYYEYMIDLAQQSGHFALSDSLYNELKEIFDASEWETSSALLKIRYKVSKENGDLDQALSSYEKLTHAGTSVMRQALMQSSLVAQRDYAEAQEKAADAQVRYTRMIFLSVILVLIAIAIVVCISVRNRFNSKKREYDQLMSELSWFKDDFTRQTEIFQEKVISNKAIIGVLSSGIDYQLGYIDRILDSYYYSTSTKRENEGKKSLEKLISDLRSDIFSEVVRKYVNIKYDNVLKKIVNVNPNLNEKEILALSLKLSGFSPRAIMVVLGIKYSTYYTYMERLKNKLESSAEDSAQTLLQLISKKK